MSSPSTIVFFFVNTTTGAPKTGLVPTFVSYTNEAGTNITPQPTITEIGHGAYTFTPAFPVDHAIVYLINPNDASAQRVMGHMRPEQFLVGQPYVTFNGGGDTTNPVIVRVEAPTRTTVLVTYSKPVKMTTDGAGALAPGNYLINRTGTTTILSVLSVTQVSDVTVQLFTATQTPGAAYNLEVLNVEDLNGNPIGEA